MKKQKLKNKLMSWICLFCLVLSSMMWEKIGRERQKNVTFYYKYLSKWCLELMTSCLMTRSMKFDISQHILFYKNKKFSSMPNFIIMQYQKNYFLEKVLSVTYQTSQDFIRIMNLLVTFYSIKVGFFSILSHDSRL